MELTISTNEEVGCFTSCHVNRVHVKAKKKKGHWFSLCPNVDHMDLKMNVALIHDRLHIKTFWEKRISNECEHAESEEQRMEKSALQKLRGEWLVRLENRTKHLKSLNDKYVRKPKAEKSAEP